MNDKRPISRRTFAGALILLGLQPKRGLAQGFAGLGESARFSAIEIRKNLPPSWNV